MPDDDNFVTRAIKSVGDMAWSGAKDLAARGKVITTTGPGIMGTARPASIDVGKLAEDQARSMGRGDATTAPKKKKPMPALSTRMSSAMEDSAP